MNFTINTVARSLADYLAADFPGVTMYEDPNQQGTSAPCLFLQQRYSNIKLYPGGRWLRTIGLDLTYLEDYNLPDLQAKYQAALEKLDMSLETFPYSDGVSTGTVQLRTYDRSGSIDLDAMHYKFELRVWVTKPAAEALMETLDATVYVEVQNGNH